MGFVGLYIFGLILLFYTFIYKQTVSSARVKASLLFGFILVLFFLVTLLLSKGWYTQIETSFHWFDDSCEWRLMDKVGHFFTAAAWSRFAVLLFIQIGVAKKLAQQRIVWLGFILLSIIEWFDGLSPNYGASAYDLLANFLGSCFVFMQYIYFAEMRLFSKWSYWPNSLAAIRPNMLGSNAGEQLLKNYNGHIFWFSTPISKLRKISFVPDWLCISIGYGADGMIGGEDNIYADSEDNIHDYSKIIRSSQIYISLDIIIPVKKTDKRWQKIIVYILSVLKFPFPAVELSTSNGLVFHWIAI